MLVAELYICYILTIEYYFDAKLVDLRKKKKHTNQEIVLVPKIKEPEVQKNEENNRT